MEREKRGASKKKTGWCQATKGHRMLNMSFLNCLCPCDSKPSFSDLPSQGAIYSKFDSSQECCVQRSSLLLLFVCVWLPKKELSFTGWISESTWKGGRVGLRTQGSEELTEIIEDCGPWSCTRVSREWSLRWHPVSTDKQGYDHTSGACVCFKVGWVVRERKF